MAFVVKNAPARAAGPTPNGQAYVDQWIHVKRAAKALPQTTNEQLFRVYGGRVIVKLLIGEVTTAIQSTDPVLSVDTSRLDDAGALVGTADVVASTIDTSSDEIGTIYVVEGDDSGLVSTQVAAHQTLNAREWLMPQGQIILVAGASKTGAIQWDLWYQPLDEGAYVVAVDTATARIS